MHVTVIHDPARLDRAQYIAKLYELYPNIILTYAQKPTWESHHTSRATRGCALAHLLASSTLLKKQESVLVLEDDAVPYQPGTDFLKAHQDLPEDAGIILLGSEVYKHDSVLDCGYAKVHPPFRGTHAVLYTPKLLNSNFFTEAYRLIATHSMGTRDLYHDALCFESVLLQATTHAGLSIYRPRIMTFTAAAGFSDRELQNIDAVDAAMHIDSDNIT